TVLSDVITLLLSADPSARPRHADWVAHELDRARSMLAASEPRASSPAPSLTAPRPAPPAASTASRLEPATIAQAERLPALHAQPTLVGRDAVLAVLGRAAREAKQGGVRVVVITGPQGVGRTRLIEAAVEQAGIAPDRVLSARGSPERRSPLRLLLRATQ